MDWIRLFVMEVVRSVAFGSKGGIVEPATLQRSCEVGLSEGT